MGRKARANTLSAWWADVDEVPILRSRSGTKSSEASLMDDGCSVVQGRSSGDSSLRNASVRAVASTADMTGVLQFQMSQSLVDQGLDSDSDDDDTFAMTFSVRP